MIDWVAAAVQKAGYLGIALLMFAENVFPPIPSELIMPLAGFAAARGELHIVPAILAGTAGAVAGASFWYAVGRWVGLERLRSWSARHGRLLTIGPAEIDAATASFERHCAKAVLIGRVIPAVRTFISVPAGIARMGVPSFLLYSALGSALWSGLLAWAGYVLEDDYRRVGDSLKPVTNVVLGVLLAWYVYRVVRFKRRMT